MLSCFSFLNYKKLLLPPFQTPGFVQDIKKFCYHSLMFLKRILQCNSTMEKLNHVKVNNSFQINIVQPEVYQADFRVL